jgi:hypothetical protein
MEPAMYSMIQSGFSARMIFLVWRSCSSVREMRKRDFAPAVAKLWAMARPIPLPAPIVSLIGD